MPRKRMIHPEYWKDQKVGTWSFEARLFYIGLWNFSDDEGKFNAHPSLLKGQIFTYDDNIDINALKEELGDKVQWYEVNGEQYGYLRNFFKHQTINHPTKSKLPSAPPPLREDSRNTTVALSESSKKVTPNIIQYNIRECNLIKESLPEGNVPGIIREYDNQKKERKAPVRTLPEILELMEHFYLSYESKFHQTYFAKNFKSDKKVFEDIIKGGLAPVKVKELIDQFFVSTLKAIQKGKYTTWSFKYALHTLTKARPESPLEESDRLRRERRAKKALESGGVHEVR